MAHPFEAIIEAIAHLELKYRRMLFVFIGDGPRLGWVKQQVEARGLSLVRFLPFQPKERLIESLGAADLHLATMEANLSGLVVPSKVAGILSVGRPCVFIGPSESEAARMIEENGFGEVLTAPSGDELARRLVDWMEDPLRMRELQKRAARVAAEVGQDAAVTAFDRLFRRVLRLPQNVTPANVIPLHTAPAPSAPRLGCDLQRNAQN